MEIRPNKIYKYNKPIVGLLIGIVLPLAVFLTYCLIKVSDNDAIGLHDFINIMKKENALVAAFSLCVLVNFIPFFIFKKKNYWYAIKGIVTSVFIYLVVILVLKFI